MNDLISRQAALDAIDENRQALLSLGMTGAEDILAHHGRRVIEELPTIDPADNGGCWGCRCALLEQAPVKVRNIDVSEFGRKRRLVIITAERNEE